MKKPTKINELDSNLEYKSSYLNKLRKKVNREHLASLVEKISDESEEIVHKGYLNFKRAERHAAMVDKWFE